MTRTRTWMRLSLLVALTGLMIAPVWVQMGSAVYINYESYTTIWEIWDDEDNSRGNFSVTLDVTIRMYSIYTYSFSFDNSYSIEGDLEYRQTIISQIPTRYDVQVIVEDSDGTDYCILMRFQKTAMTCESKVYVEDIVWDEISLFWDAFWNCNRYRLP